MNNNLGALDLITTSRDIVTQDLRGVFSFRYLASQLEEIQSVIGKMLLGDFKTYISSEIYKDIAHAKVRKKKSKFWFFGKIREFGGISVCFFIFIAMETVNF